MHILSRDYHSLMMQVRYITQVINM